MDSPENRSPIEPPRLDPQPPSSKRTEVDNHQKFFKDEALAEQSETSSDAEEIADSEETCLNGCQGLEARITEERYNKGGFFSFSYIDFEINTEPFDWVVRRWEIDFIKLREYYVKAFPQYVIPPLIVEDADSESR